MATIVCSSYKLLLGLLFVATMTSSSVRPSHVAEQLRRRSSIINVRRGVASGRSTFDVVASPSSRRLVAAPDSRSSSAAFRGELRDDKTTPPGDEKRFPAKRRWNSGNLRVWGKRSPALRYVGDQLYGRVGREPIWLLPATAIDGDQAPAMADDWTESRPLLSGTSWNEASQRVNSESTKRRDRRTWNNIDWRV